MACSRVVPHISAEGCRPAQKAGRSGWPKMRQRLSSASWMQRTPAGLPFGMPGIGLVIEGAVQQAPQSLRQAGAVRLWFMILRGGGAALTAGGVLILQAAWRRRDLPGFFRWPARHGLRYRARHPVTVVKRQVVTALGCC